MLELLFYSLVMSYVAMLAKATLGNKPEGEIKDLPTRSLCYQKAIPLK